MHAVDLLMCVALQEELAVSAMLVSRLMGRGLASADMDRRFFSLPFERASDDRASSAGTNNTLHASEIFNINGFDRIDVINASASSGGGSTSTGVGNAPLELNTTIFGRNSTYKGSRHWQQAVNRFSSVERARILKDGALVRRIERLNSFDVRLYKYGKFI